MQVLSQPPSKFTEMGGHVAISATLPSGRARVRSACNALSVLLQRGGTLPLCEFGPEDLVPCVRHMTCGPSCERPDAIFIGVPTNACQVSPWSMPLPLESFCVNADFLRARSDLRPLLWPLRNKILQCDCNKNDDERWALFLVGVFVRTFIP